MEWIKIKKGEILEGKLLVANFKPHTYGYREKIIGYLREENEGFVCENEHEILNGATHYINIKQFDIIEIQNNDKFV